MMHPQFVSSRCLERTAEYDINEPADRLFGVRPLCGVDECVGSEESMSNVLAKSVRFGLIAGDQPFRDVTAVDGFLVLRLRNPGSERVATGVPRGVSSEQDDGITV